MNKKVLIGIIAVVVVCAVVIGIVCITKGGKLKEATLKEDLGYEDSQISATVGYSAKAGFTEKEDELDNFIELENKDKNYSVELGLRVDTTYESNKDGSKEEEGYKEVKFNKYDGYIYKASDSRITGAILLEGNEEDNLYKYIALDVEIIDTYEEGKEVSIDSIYESKEVQTILNSIKCIGVSKIEDSEEAKEEDKQARKGEFADRTDGISDKDGLIFIPSFKSPNEELYKAEQRNDNIGIDNYLWYTSDKKAYESSGIEVRIIPKTTEYASFDEYKEDKGDLYHWSKTKIAGKEYDTYTFGSDSKTPEKYSVYHSGAFMVGNKVVEFHYNMYKEVPDQSAGDKFFTQIMNSVEYSKDFVK